MQKPNEATLNKIKGALLGYVIGDAVGAPVSGMTKEDVRKSTGDISHFIINFRHPFFYFLKKGQYSSTARMMLFSLASLAAHKGYNHLDLKNRLREDAIRSKEDFFYSRWLGQTAIHALLEDKPIASSSITNVSRSVPIALLYDNLDQIAEYADKQSLITHSSPVSLAASYFVSVSLFLLKNGGEAREVFRKALQMTAARYQGIDELRSKLELAVEHTDEIGGIEKARVTFDTGSLAHQTIPLAVWVFLTYRDKFVEGVTAGANSYRLPPKEKNTYSYIEELLFLYGGNTCGITALYCAFYGAIYGLDKIPASYLEPLEDREETLRQIDAFFI